MNDDKKISLKWAKEKNTTPTFELTPIEKPDMSPYLIHLTEKGSLLGILKGSNQGSSISNRGHLNASIPIYATPQFHSPVVCFTESPIFALDFFRKRSLKRFTQDQRYGIGFSKAKMIRDYGVRPVVYLDKTTNSKFQIICSKIELQECKLSDDAGQNKSLLNFFKELKPLIFPMFEETPLQGFMWEREWRYPNASGLSFHYETIEIICCPADEKQEIMQVLGDNATKVTFIENWREYNELTGYLKNKDIIKNGDMLIENEYDIGILMQMQFEIFEKLNTLQNYKNALKHIDPNLHTAQVDDLLDKFMMYDYRVQLQIEMCEGYEQIKFEEMQQAYLREYRF
ncbi:abortive infection system antitoxin AbiGi family protein [Mucilaginibacter flavus]|uniref:abortive infection system antitoxin AbiGi family protein n=1 Tax=Mucilaginibacter flavus TaxID=931504 RepID=UPI0025B3D82B|nr:abortive infection system antitoxin AbiGi family protein [Mucilaginibacter flavus]MDN3582419.1 abortive infection system antitoxin AbiGi family protein [Mucilaginibacter flavus]